LFFFCKGQTFCFIIMCLRILPGKAIPEMTYTVSGGTLKPYSLTYSLTYSVSVSLCVHLYVCMSVCVCVVETQQWWHDRSVFFADSTSRLWRAVYVTSDLSATRHPACQSVCVWVTAQLTRHWCRQRWWVVTWCQSSSAGWPVFVVPRLQLVVSASLEQTSSVHQQSSAPSASALLGTWHLQWFCSFGGAVTILPYFFMWHDLDQ